MTKADSDDKEEVAARRREAGKRARAEAEARRKPVGPPGATPEIGGRKGPEPTRFGDWEKDGIAVDF